MRSKAGTVENNFTLKLTVGRPQWATAPRLSTAAQARMPKLRAGSDAAARLLASGSLQEWAEAFDRLVDAAAR